MFLYSLLLPCCRGQRSPAVVESSGGEEEDPEQPFVTGLQLEEKAGGIFQHHLLGLDDHTR